MPGPACAGSHPAPARGVREWIVASGRRARRLAAFARFCVWAGWNPPQPDPCSRAEWVRRHADIACRSIGMDLCVTGDPGDADAWVGNHTGYLDILGLATVRPAAFISKSEVRSWPVIGSLAQRGGTVFVDRGRRASLPGVAQAMRERVAAGVPVIFFPEGTSSDGHAVLPFHPSLFAPAVENGWRLAPFAIQFECLGPAGIMPTYWGDMTFAPHFLALLGHSRLRMHIRFGEVGRIAGDRRNVAREWEARVRAEHAALRTTLGRAADHCGT